jgi:hypothetical protein
VSIELAIAPTHLFYYTNMKIRIGNDIDMLLAFKENGQSVDLTTVSNINISIILNNGDCISTTTT